MAAAKPEPDKSVWEALQPHWDALVAAIVDPNFHDLVTNPIFLVVSAGVLLLGWIKKWKLFLVIYLGVFFIWGVVHYTVFAKAAGALAYVVVAIMLVMMGAVYFLLIKED